MFKYYPLCQHYARFLVVPIMWAIMLIFMPAEMPAYLTQAYIVHHYNIVKYNTVKIANNNKWTVVITNNVWH